MATSSGSYKETNIASLAALETLVNAHLAVEEARITALSGASTLTTGTISITMLADNGAGATYNHRYSQGIHCILAADTVTLVAAIEIILAAMLAESAYSTLQVVDVVLSTIKTG